jgi:hypothetical protein
VYLSLSQEHIHRLHVKPLAMRTFCCSATFRRDEIYAHLLNVHQQIRPGLESGWLEQPCPLRYLGCAFSCRNIAPSTPFQVKSVKYVPWNFFFM